MRNIFSDHEIAELCAFIAFGTGYACFGASFYVDVVKSQERKMEKQNPATNKRTFFILWILCIVGSWSVLSYVHYLGILPDNISMLKVFLLSTSQSALFFGLICLLGFKILPKTDLHPFFYRKFSEQIVYPGVIAGISVGGALFFFSSFSQSLRIVE